jgi:hypothetical protein
VEKGLPLAMLRKKAISVHNAIKTGGKKTERKKSKQSLKTIVDAFNYDSEPCSINTESWYEGKW